MSGEHAACQASPGMFAAAATGVWDWGGGAGLLELSRALRTFQGSVARWRSSKAATRVEKKKPARRNAFIVWLEHGPVSPMRPWLTIGCSARLPSALEELDTPWLHAQGPAREQAGGWSE